MAIVPKGIVVHSMGEYLQWEGEWITAHDFLKELKLSVHGFIHPDGTYEKMISSPGKAAHAGKSEWNGLQHLNSHYLGFELLVPGKQTYDSFLKAIEEEGISDIIARNWRGLIKPTGASGTGYGVIPSKTNSKYGKFVVRPLERGYGITLGNSLRRILLS